MAEAGTADAADPAPEPAAPVGAFERDTAVALSRREHDGASFDAEVADGWVAGRGPHGGYLAAMLLRALEETVADPARTPRSLTIHYTRAPHPGPVRIDVRIERRGRSLSTLSARMEQDEKTVALVLASFSVPWSGPELDDLPLPDVQGPDPGREAGTAMRFGAPPFTRHLVMQPRFRGAPLTGERRPMELGAWVGLAEARPLDHLALAFFCDALIPSPFMATGEPAAAPTIDLTVHFRSSLVRHGAPDEAGLSPRHGAPDEAGLSPRHGAPDDEQELCYAQVSCKLVHEGFFEEDCVIWAADGSVLAQSRQLAILLPRIG